MLHTTIVKLEFHAKCTNKFLLICCLLKTVGPKYVSIIETLLYMIIFIIIIYYTFMY